MEIVRCGDGCGHPYGIFGFVPRPDPYGECSDLSGAHVREPDEEVVAVGNGKIGEDGNVTPLDVKKGDKILFSKYSGSEIDLDGEEHLIMREDDVLAVLE